jgi:hypothetical protein
MGDIPRLLRDFRVVSECDGYALRFQEAKTRDSCCAPSQMGEVDGSSVILDEMARL